MNFPIWQHVGADAYQLVGAAVDVSIDLTHTELGLAIECAGRKNSSGIANIAPSCAHVFGVAISGRLLSDTARMDAYVRGTDLVATFEGTSQHPLRLQAYWRSIPAAEFAPNFAANVLAAFDLIVSVNTSLLDDDPQSKVCSAIAPASLVNLHPAGNELSDSGNAVPGGVFLVRCAADVSWIEMVHPSDFCHSIARTSSQQNPVVDTLLPSNAQGIQITHGLFRQRLEKGVILRARVRGALAKQMGDQETAVDAYQKFAVTEPPLTV